MGNATSNNGEKDAWKVIKWIPIVNVAYAIPRSVVYAAKGDGDAAVSSALAIPNGIFAAGGYLIGGPGGGMAASGACTAFCAAAGFGYDLSKNASAAGANNTTVAALQHQGAINTEIKELRSLDGRFQFVMQNDKNIVLYHGSTPIWASNTWVSAAAQRRDGPFKLVLQADGNFVAYDRHGHPYWASDTWHCGPGPYNVVMQNDGNCVLYDKNGKPHWSTNTYGR